jgi:hypothetical protein
MELEAKYILPAPHELYCRRSAVSDASSQRKSQAVGSDCPYSAIRHDP